jgi:hypothetical protein
VLRVGSSFRCEARSQPCATGVCGSIAPWKTISSPEGSNARSTTNRSASAVLEETNSFAADGPVISTERSSGAPMNVIPSPSASYDTQPPSDTGEKESARPSGSR